MGHDPNKVENHCSKYYEPCDGQDISPPSYNHTETSGDSSHSSYIHHVCALPMIIVRYMYMVYHYFLFSFDLLMFILE